MLFLRCQTGTCREKINVRRYLSFRLILLENESMDPTPLFERKNTFGIIVYETYLGQFLWTDHRWFWLKWDNTQPKIVILCLKLWKCEKIIICKEVFSKIAHWQRDDIIDAFSNIHIVLKYRKFQATVIISECLKFRPNLSVNVSH